MVSAVFSCKGGITLMNGKRASLAEMLPEKPNDQGRVYGKLVWLGADPLYGATLQDGIYIRVDNPKWKPGRSTVAAWLYHESHADCLRKAGLIP